MYFLKRLLLAIALSFCSESAIAQTAELVNLPQEAQFGHGYHLPYLVEHDRDVVEVICEEGKPVVLFEKGTGNLFFSCKGQRTPLQLFVAYAAFDSKRPHLKADWFGNVTVACFYGDPKRLTHTRRWLFVCH